MIPEIITSNQEIRQLNGAQVDDFVGVDYWYPHAFVNSGGDIIIVDPDERWNGIKEKQRCCCDWKRTRASRRRTRLEFRWILQLCGRRSPRGVGSKFGGSELF